MAGRGIFEEMEQRMDELRREFMGRMGGGPAEAGGALTPAMDVVDEDNRFVVTMELPGVDKTDVNLDVDENSVRVTARKEAEKREGEQEGRGFVRRERTGRTYERLVTLPEEVSPDGSNATFRNGVLTVTLPKKSPEERRARRIDIS